MPGTNRLQCLACRYSLNSSALTQVSTETHQGQFTRKFNIILAHANGFVKELYEPFIYHLLLEVDDIEAVYIHDIVSQGFSGLRNANLLGDESPWFDPGRDILQMIIHARATGMLCNGPLVGIGHSMGGCQILYASSLHQRMFEACIAIDPIIEESKRLQERTVGPTNIAILSMKRRNRWPSREVARESFRKSPFYRAWDPDVLDRMIYYGLSSVSEGVEEVKLTTSPAQEVYSFMHWLPHTGSEETDPDCVSYVYNHLPFYKHPVHFIFGADSTTVPDEARERLKNRPRQGTRLDVPKTGHLVPMESPKILAQACARHVSRAYDAWQAQEVHDAKLLRAGLELTPDYKDNLQRILVPTQTNPRDNKNKSRL